MRPHELEAWILEVVDRVRGRRPVEDDRVEVKTDFVDARRAGRRLAGHLNASRGADVLWIIGANEKTGEVDGADFTEFDGWWRSVASEFIELEPPIQVINAPVGDGRVVVGILASAERAPYVVKNAAYGGEGGGSVEREVPWREGTGIRSATRSDLIRLLTPVVRLPRLELRSADATLHPPRDAAGGTLAQPQYQLIVKATLYLEPATTDTLIYPHHRTWLELRSPWAGDPKSLTPGVYESTDIELLPGGLSDFPGLMRSSSTPLAMTVEKGAEQLIVHGPGLVNIYHHGYLAEPFTHYFGDRVALTLSIEAADAERPSTIEVDLHPSDWPHPGGSGPAAFWRFGAEVAVS